MPEMTTFWESTSLDSCHQPPLQSLSNPFLANALRNYINLVDAGSNPAWPFTGASSSAR